MTDYGLVVRPGGGRGNADMLVTSASSYVDVADMTDGCIEATRSRSCTSSGEISRAAISDCIALSLLAIDEVDSATACVKCGGFNGGELSYPKRSCARCLPLVRALPWGDLDRAL
jgi:hypothetical protein